MAVYDEDNNDERQRAVCGHNEDNNGDDDDGDDEPIAGRLRPKGQQSSKDGSGDSVKAIVG